MTFPKTYGETVIPGTQITVKGGGTIAVSRAFSQDQGIVGTMDTSNGTATPGEVETFTSVSEAEDLFGEDSELARAAAAAKNNRAQEIHAVAVSDTEQTDNETASSSGTLAESPIIDPNTSPSYDITAEDGAQETIDVNLVYEDTVTSPSDAQTMNLNPVSGDWEADESDDYDITYHTGDYTAAIDALLPKTPRIVSVQTASSSVTSHLATELENDAGEFDFMHGVVNAEPTIDPDTFSQSTNESRIVMVAPSRAYVDDAETEMVMTAAAVGGLFAGLALGDSGTYNTVRGLTALRREFTPSEAGKLTDERVAPLLNDGGIKLIKDQTTSEDVKFERLYSNEIVDEATELSHQITQQFVGELNTARNRQDLEESHRTVYQEMQNDRPPLLDNYSVSAEQDSSDDETVNVTVGLDVVNVIDTIDVTIVVGDVITNAGAS